MTDHSNPLKGQIPIVPPGQTLSMVDEGKEGGLEKCRQDQADSGNV